MKLRFPPSISAAVVIVWCIACSSTPTGKSVVSDAIAAIGGDKVTAVRTVSMKGGRVKTNVGGHGGVGPFAELENDGQDSVSE